MWCTRLAKNTGHKKSPKICHLGTITQLSPAISSHLRYVLTIGKKPVKQQYLLHMFSQHGERRPTNGWHRFRNFGHPSKFQRVSRVGFVTTPTSLNGRQPNFARCLAVSWAGTIYTLCLKNVPPLACYNFDAHEWILIFFGRNVTDKVGN